MKTNKLHIKKNEEGIALLVTLLLLGVLLAIGASLLNITLKQYQFSGMALASETAFQAANAGMECILYYDNDPNGSVFDVPGDGSGRSPVLSLNCMNENSSDIVAGNGTCFGCNEGGAVESGEEQMFEFEWGSPRGCSQVSVYKFYSTSDEVSVEIDDVFYRADGSDADSDPDPCPIGGICTVVQARGYDVSCSDVGTAARVVEREYTIVY